MDKAWSFLFLIVAVVVMATIIIEMLKPFLIIFGIILALTIIAVIGASLFRLLNNKSRFF